MEPDREISKKEKFKSLYRRFEFRFGGDKGHWARDNLGGVREIFYCKTKEKKTLQKCMRGWFCVDLYPWTGIIVDLYSQLWWLYLQCIYSFCTTWFTALLKLDSNVSVYRIANSQLFCRNICCFFFQFTLYALITCGNVQIFRLVCKRLNFKWFYFISMSFVFSSAEILSLALWIQTYMHESVSLFASSFYAFYRVKVNLRILFDASRKQCTF